MYDRFSRIDHCQRCGKSLAHGSTMSRFNTQIICMDCAEAETKREDYKKAVEAEREAIKHGDFNFSGIGLK